MSKVTKRVFGQTADGGEVFAFRFEGAGGAYMEVTNYGAAWVKAVVPDREGSLADVCLSYDTLDGYLSDCMYIGATVGRLANRVKDAAFTLNGIEYQLGKNDGDHSLHGGFDGFNKRLWDYEELDGAVAFRLRSADGDEGFPGNIDVCVTYSFDGAGALAIDYLAVSDKDTPVNLTNHAYFNLAGAGTGKAGAMAQTIRINADFITETAAEYIPTGLLLPVENTPLDLREAAVIGDRLDSDHPQMRPAGGYDVNYAVAGEGLREAAALACPQNGVSLRVLMTNPGIQFYTGNMIGAPFAKHGAVCLEPQHYPDSVNQPRFPTCILKAGEEYRERTEYRFSAE